MEKVISKTLRYNKYMNRYHPCLNHVTRITVFESCNQYCLNREAEDS